jgi:glycosyltransferase involved in cell wall biosynthesis
VGPRTRRFPRVALVHDWLTGMRGGERCLDVFCELFPDAPLYTLLHVPGSVSPRIEGRQIITSFVQRLPRARERYRHYLPLFPLAVRTFDLRGYDLVLSLSHCVAKAAPARRGALHICYCFTPMRYVWDLADDYVTGAGRATRLLMPPLAAALRRWDRRTTGVHAFVAISHHIADRIRRAYGREADVLHPPVELSRFHIGAPQDFYLVVSALTPYKRVDLAVEAANRLRRRLLVVGTGPEARALRVRAGPTVEFLGWRPDAEVADLYSRCRAVLFTAVEDYGIVPLEAAAAGRPTIALARGGVLETMVGLPEKDDPTVTGGVQGSQTITDGVQGTQTVGDGCQRVSPTAVFFAEQTVESLLTGIQRFEANESRFEPGALRAHAAKFDRPRFAQQLREALDRRWREFHGC